MSVFRKRMPFEERRGLAGYVFIAPWLVGIIAFFILPMFSALVYLFNSVTIVSGGLKTKFVGFLNFQKVFMNDPEPIRLIVTSLGSTFTEALLIVAFSLLLAIMLNQKFKGRMLARALFALPIIVSSGVLMSVFKEDLFAQSMVQSSDVTIFQSTALRLVMYGAGLNDQLVNIITGLVNQILDLVWKSGVQILLFLAALQSIPKQLYEVCDVEGATPWQVFWSVVFPLMTPFILLNIVYSIIDSFTFYNNPVIQKITAMFNNLNYELSTTLAVTYCLFILLLTGMVTRFISRRVFYIEN